MMRDIGPGKPVAHSNGRLFQINVGRIWGIVGLEQEGRLSP